jgi:hypothetical protein
VTLGSKTVNEFGDTLQIRGQHKPGSDAALFEVIPENELPIDCASSHMDRCAKTAAVWVTASSGYERRPLCEVHAATVFAEWMVGI